MKTSVPALADSKIECKITVTRKIVSRVWSSQLSCHAVFLDTVSEDSAAPNVWVGAEGSSDQG